MDYKLKNRDGIETTYIKEKIKIPAATGDSMVVFTQGEVQPEKAVTIAENGTTEVTPDAGYGSVKKVGVTVEVPATKPDWQENDPNSQGYIQNRPGAYDVLSPAIEWDGNMDGKTVVSLGDVGNFSDPKLVKVSDEFIYADQLIGKTPKYTSTQIKEGQPQVLDFPMDKSNTLQDNLDTGATVTFVTLGSGDDAAYLVFSLNQPNEDLGIPEAGTYFGDFIVFANSVHTSLLPAREKTVKLPAKYIDDALLSEIASMKTLIESYGERLNALEGKTKEAT